MKTLVVWDFHGVLEKNNDKAVVKITNHILKLHGFSEALTEELAFFSFSKASFL